MSSSKSDSRQTQNQDSQDNRIAAAEGSVNLVASRSNIGEVSIFNSTTDHGAVDGAFKFANATADSAFKFANANSDSAFKFGNAALDAAHAAQDGAFKLTDGTVSKAFNFAAMLEQGAADERAASAARDASITKDAMSAVRDSYEKSTEAVSAAYETAKAGEQKIMVAVGVAAVALIAVKALGK